MPEGLNRQGDFRNGTPITLPHDFGTDITEPHDFGNDITEPKDFGNPVMWLPNPARFGNLIAPPITQLSTPVATPAGGSYTSAQQVTLATDSNATATYYTTDGSTPTTASTLYTGAITTTGSGTETIKAFSHGAGAYSDSAIMADTYAIFSTPALAFFARLATQPSAALQVAYNNLINSLVADGIWSALDVLYVFATSASATALTNLVSSSFTATPVGVPTFTAGVGFSSSGTGNYLTSNYNPHTAGGNLSEDNAFVSVWSGDAQATSGNSILGQVGAGNPWTDIAPTYYTSSSQDGTAVMRCFCTGGVQPNTYTGSGMFTVQKTSSGHVSYLRRGGYVPAMVQSGEMSLTTTGTDEILSANITLLQGYYTSGAAYPGPILFAAWGSQLTSTQVAQFYFALSNFLAASSSTFVAHGDSITYGYTLNSPVLTYVSQLCDLQISTHDTPTAYECYGSSSAGFFTPGDGTVDTLTLIQSAPISIDPYLGSVSNPVLIVFGGTNDIWLSGKTAAQTYAGFQTYIETRIAAGWNNIIVLTMLPRQSGAPNEATRQAFNTLLRNGAATYGYTVADIGNDPTIGQAGDQTNTTYYASDQIHLTQAGQLIVAQDILAVL